MALDTKKIREYEVISPLGDVMNYCMYQYTVIRYSDSGSPSYATVTSSHRYTS